MPTVLTINGQTQRCDAETITIGRAAGNTISLPNDERLAPLHAVLRSVAGRWIVESKDGGPVRVGAGRPTQFAWINPGDVIYLTETGPEIVFEPQMGSAPSPAKPVSPLSPYIAPILEPAPTKPAAAAAQQPQVAKRSSAPIEAAVDEKGAARASGPLYIAAGGIAAMLLIGLGVFVASWGRGAPQEDRETADRNKTVAAGDLDEPPRTVAKQAASGANPRNEPAPVADPKRALFRIELQTADGTRSVQLGTAWAVAPRRLVTTGDAARGLELNREFYPTAIARHSLTRETFEIAATTLHPQYESAAGRLDQAVRAIERLKAEYGETQDAEDRQRIEGELHRLDSAAILAADDAVNVNVALLDVARDLPATALSWNAAQASSAKVGQKFSLVGHPLPRRDLLVDPDHPIPPEQRVGRLQRTEAAPDIQVPPRWLLSFDDALREQNWSGSPVLDANGVVVGVYARPTPPVAGAPSGPIVTHDVTVIESLKTLISGQR